MAKKLYPSPVSVEETAEPQPFAPRGRRAIPIPPPWVVIEAIMETYTRDGALIHQTMYLPAYWPPSASAPRLFAADIRTPHISRFRGQRRWRMFSTRYGAVRWLLRQAAKGAAV